MPAPPLLKAWRTYRAPSINDAHKSVMLNIVNMLCRADLNQIVWYGVQRRLLTATTAWSCHGHAEPRWRRDQQPIHFATHFTSSEVGVRQALSKMSQPGFLQRGTKDQIDFLCLIPPTFCSIVWGAEPPSTYFYVLVPTFLSSGRLSHDHTITRSNNQTITQSHHHTITQ